MAYSFEHSVECPVSRDFAWRFWSDVSNWAAVDPAVDAVDMDGPFVAGTKGVTKLSVGAPVEWELIEVRDGEGAIVEIVAPGAVVRFHWMFAELAGGGTLLTQRVTLEGERAKDYMEGMRELEKGIPDGMGRLAQAMVTAADSAA